jgi:hypothetical protein
MSLMVAAQQPGQRELSKMIGSSCAARAIATRKADIRAWRSLRI